MNIISRCLAVLICMLAGNIATAQNPLFIPPVLNGPVYNLEMQNGRTVIVPGHNAYTMGFNGSFLGPTLILQAGTQVKMNVLNSLGEESTVHWHGLHVSPENDGGPHGVIGNNETWSPTFTVLNKAATYWYHPHLHHFTERHVARGLAGMIIVRDNNESALNLPRTYGVDDIPVIIQSKDLNTVTDTFNYGPSAVRDSILLVNGTYKAIVNVPQQMVRLRVINTSATRMFNLGLSNNGTFLQCASDAGLLSSLVSKNRMLLGPGERAELIVNFASFSLGQTISLMSYASELQPGFFGGNAPLRFGIVMPNYSPNAMNGANFDVLKFNVVAPTANPNPVTSGNISSSLATVTPPAGPVGVIRTKYFGNGVFTNASNVPQPYDLNVNNDTVKLDSTEIWILKGDQLTAHPFHIHDVSFNILYRADSNNVITNPTGGDLGYKDVVMVNPNETVAITMKFEDFTSDMPYVYHCHILNHEDGGMMQNFVVIDNIYVDKNNNGTQTGSFAQPFKKFEDAVAMAKNGSTIVFKSNGDHTYTYPPYITVQNKRIRIKLTTGAVTIN